MTAIFAPFYLNSRYFYYKIVTTPLTAISDIAIMKKGCEKISHFYNETDKTM